MRTFVLIAQVLIGTGFGLTTRASSAETPSAAGAPVVRASRDGELFIGQGAFDVDAGLETTWAVITDYAGISRFVSSVRSSSVVDRTEDRVIVEQRLLGRFLFFTREVHLRLLVRETRQRLIKFVDLGGKDFETYSGSWTFSTIGGRTHVAYRVAMKLRDGLPGFIGMASLESEASALLGAVRQEVLRRDAECSARKRNNHECL